MLNRPLSIALCALAVALGGCQQRDLRPLNPCTINGFAERVNVTNVDKVDLLFMIDNSGSMEEEQTSLATEIPRLVQTLASGVARDGSTFPAVRDLRVGVVSSDMGTGGYSITTCNEPNYGDDGVLRRGSGCIDAGAPPYLGFRPADGGDPAAFATDVQCVANLGITGCGFEQQLDAVLKAVTPSSSPITFVNGTRGQNDAMNAGFVRDDSLLAIIMLTDEDDCSAANPDIFNRSSGTFTDPDLNLRCWRYGDPGIGAVHPIQRYVDGLLEVKEPELLVFAAIVGIPVDLVPSGDAEPNYAALVSPEEMVRDPRMWENPDPAMPAQLEPSCSVPGRGVAYPPVRIVRTAQALAEAEASTVIQSICQDDYSGALDAIIAKIADVLSATCLPRPLNQDSEGRVLCDVVEVLPLEGEVTDCAQVAGRVFREIDPDTGRQVCQVCQTNSDGNIIDTNADCQALALSQPAGWYYESGSDLARCPENRRQAISFHTGTEPTTGSIIRLECLQLAGSGDEGVTIGTGCGGDDAGLCANGTIGGASVALTCDSSGNNTCELACSSTADCVNAGLGGYVCHDDGTLGPDGNPDNASFCVNPTCTTN